HVAAGEIRTGVQEEIPERPVLAAQANRHVTRRLARGEAVQQVVRDGAVRLKLGEMMAYVLVPGVPQKIERGLVGPEDRAVEAQPVDGYWSLLEQILQLVQPVLFVSYRGTGRARLVESHPVNSARVG